MSTHEERVAALVAYVNAAPGDDYIEQCATAAHDLITAKIGTHTVPAPILMQAFLEVGANLFNRRSHTRDTSTGLEADTTPAFFRPALDPMTPAWPILSPYIHGPGVY